MSPRFWDLVSHLERMHLYDFGTSDVCVDDEHAVELLHDELHRRGDFGLRRHRLGSRFRL